LALFRAIQVETPLPAGPPDGRYLLRPEAGADPSHVLVFAGRLSTVIDVGTPLADAAAGAGWTRRAGEEELADGLRILGQALHLFRLVIADPDLHPPARAGLLVARVGYGDGDALADGRLSESRELDPPKGRRRFLTRRSKVIEPQARLAAALSRREAPLVCEELALRAQADVGQKRWREAALQLLVCLDAAIAELSVDPAAVTLGDRIDELRGERPGVQAAAQSALAGDLSPAQRDTVAHTLGRIESAFRARAVANA
jgi:hypothetical protein